MATPVTILYDGPAQSQTVGSRFERYLRNYIQPAAFSWAGTEREYQEWALESARNFLRTISASLTVAERPDKDMKK